MIRTRAGLLACLLPVSIAAQTTVWTGGGNSNTAWNNSANWSAGVPTSTSIASFQNNTKRDPNLTANASVGQIRFSGSDDAETFSGSSYTLILYGVSGLGIDVQINRAPTFAPKLQLAGDQTWQATNSGGGSITANGGVALGGYDLTLNAATSANSITIASVLSGTGNVTVAGAGTTTFSGSTSNTYSGNVTVNDGTLVLNKSSGVTAVTGDLLIGDGSGTDTVRLNASNQIANGSAVTLGAGGTPTLNLNGFNDTIGSLASSNTAAAVTLGGGTLTTGGDNSSTTFDGVISGTGGDVTKTGTGTFTLTGANTYTGITTINNGTFSVNTLANGGVASGVGSSTNAATNLVLNGGTLQYTGAATTTNRLFSVGTSGGTIDASGSGLLTFSNTSAMGFNGQTGNRTLTLTGTGSGSLAALIADNSGVTTVNKTGTGSWTLGGGANTYTGATNITGGTLVVTTAASGNSSVGSLTGGAVNVSGGGTLDLGGSTTQNALNFATKQINISGSGVGGAGAIINSGSLTQNNAFQKVALTGNATIGGTGRFDLRNGTPLLDLAGYTLTKTGTNQVSVVGGSVSAGNIIVDQGMFALQNAVNVTGAGMITVNSGATLGFWNNTGSITRAMTFNGGSTIWNENYNSTIGSAITLGAGTTTMDTSAGNTLTLTGAIGGTGGMNKVSAGTLELSGTSNYTGGTTISAGTLKLSSVAGMGSAGAAVTLAGGTLDLATNTSANAYATTVTADSTILSDKATAASNGITHTLGTLSIGNQTLSIAAGSNVSTDTNYGVTFGATTLTNAATFDVANNGTGTGTLTMGAVTQSGTGSVTKTGSGTLVYSGNNSYTGGTTLSAGGLTVNAGANLAGATGGLTVNGGLLSLNNAAQTVGSLNGSGGTIALGSGHSLTVNDTGSDSYAGVFTGASNTTLIKSGTGTLTLSGNSTGFNGAVNVNQGTLIAAANGALGTTTGSTTVASGATLGLQGGITYSTAEPVTISGSGAVGRAGAIDNISGTNSLAGPITLLTDAQIGATAGSLTLSGAINLAASAPADKTLTFSPAASASITVNGKISDVLNTNYQLNVAHVGNGTVTLGYSYPTDGSDGYYGNTTIGTAGGNTTGTLVINAANGLPMRNDTSAITIYSGTLSLNNVNATAFGNLNLGGGASGSTAAVTTGTGTLTLNHDITYSAANNANGATISGNVALASGSHFLTINDSTGAANDLTISAAISGAGAISKKGTGTLVLSGANSYTGTTVVEAGVLKVQNNTALGTTAAGTNVYSGASLQLSNVSVSGESLAIDGTGGGNGALRGVSGTNSWSGAVTIAGTNARVQADSGTTLTLSGPISSSASGTLEVGGVGNTTISGAMVNSVSGLTKKDSGTLTLSGNNALVGPIAVQGGILSAQSNSALGASNTTTVSNGATLEIRNASVTGTIAINGSGVGGVGALNNAAGANTFAGSVTVGSSSLITANSGTSLLISGGTTSTAGASQTLQIGSTANNGNITISGVMNNGTSFSNAVGLQKNGSGSLTLSGAGTSTLGAVALNAGSISVGGSSTINTSTFGSATGTTLTIASGGSIVANYGTGTTTYFSGSMTGGSNSIFEKDGAGTLVFNNAGGFDASGLTLVLNGGTLKLLNTNPSGTSTFTFGTLHITGDTVLDFGNSAGTFLSSTNLIIDPNAHVTVTNWVSVANTASQSTIWYLRSGAGTGGLLNNSTTLGGSDIVGGSGLSNIQFSGSNQTTTWVSGNHNGWFDHEIRPTPEPSTYGAIFIGGCLGFLGWRRYRRRTAATV